VPWGEIFVDEDSRDVALVGDAHPENIGTYRTGAGLVTIDFNDFDAATWGPFELDVRRLAVSFFVACRQAQAGLPADERELLDDADCAAVVRAVPDGYLDELRALEDDAERATIPVPEGSFGAIATALFDDAIEDGEAGKALADATRVVDGRRVMFEGDVAPARLVPLGEREQLVIEHSLRAIGTDERALVDALVVRWMSTVLAPGAVEPEVVGVVRRYGAGIASYPLLRWYVLLDGPTTALDDDLLLEIKEVRDAIPLPGLDRPIDAPHASNGARIVGMQRTLRQFVDSDAWLGWADDGGQSFRVIERSGWQDGFEVASLAPELVARDWTAGDIVEFAALAGRLLARDHAHARKQDGEPGLAAIARSIDDDSDFADATARFALEYGAVVEADFVLYGELLATHGPDLGYAR
jgi:hypothetical protein